MINQFPPSSINSSPYFYKTPDDIYEWLACPKCSMKPRVWSFDNGRYTSCGCRNNSYDGFTIEAKSIGQVVSESGGSAIGYDPHELRENWNEYCRGEK